MRGKGKQTIVWLLMGMLVLGLGGFGVTNFSGGTADVGAVGDVEISSQDYARALRTEIQGFAAQTGRQLTPAEAKSIGLDQAALSRLYVAAALEDEANRIGVSVGDKAVADQITAIPAFKGLDGRFDRARYADALKREGLREAEFEHDLRMDEARQILQGATLAAVAASPARTATNRGQSVRARCSRNHCSCCRPASARASIGPSSTSCRRAATSAADRTSTRIAAAPPTSRRDPPVPVMTGRPAAKASTTGRPKPSQDEG